MTRPFVRMNGAGNAFVVVNALEQPFAPTAEQVRALLAKGAIAGWFSLSVDDARAEFERLKAAGVDFTDEISEKDYGIDFGVRDPFGNRIRIGTINPS